MPTKNMIKAWLGEIEKDREWLGSKLGVSKRTIDNWLSSPVEIPELKLRIIAELMEVEKKAYNLLHQPLLISPSKEQFNQWNNAWKHSDFPTLEDWAIAGLDTMAAEEEQPHALHIESPPIADRYIIPESPSDDPRFSSYLNEEPTTRTPGKTGPAEMDKEHEA